MNKRHLLEWIQQVMDPPVEEVLQQDGRIRRWAAIPEMEGQYLRVILLASLEIAFQFNLYAYDAYFLQCAQSMKCPLITLDQRMKDVAKELNITVLE